MEQETTLISKCHGAEVGKREDEAGLWYTCAKCYIRCDVEEVCAFCLGTGEVSVDEQDGEGHTMRGVGSEKCGCKIKEQEFDNQEI